MKCKLIVPCDGPAGIQKAGTEIEHPKAWKLCVGGVGNSPAVAVAADAECQARVDADLARRQRELNRLRLEFQRIPKDKSGQPVPRNESQKRVVELAEAYHIYTPPEAPAQPTRKAA